MVRSSDIFTHAGGLRWSQVQSYERQGCRSSMVAEGDCKAVSSIGEAFLAVFGPFRGASMHWECVGR